MKNDARKDLNTWLRWIINLIEARIAVDSTPGYEDLKSAVQVLAYMIGDTDEELAKKEAAYRQFFKVLFHMDNSPHSMNIIKWHFGQLVYDEINMALIAYWHQNNKPD